MKKLGRLSKINAAYAILKKAKRPMHCEEIIAIALKHDLIKTSGKTPQDTLYVDIMLENKRRMKSNKLVRFEKVGPSTWAAI